MKEKHLFSQQVFEEMERRVGRDHLSKRLRLQVEHTAIKFSGGGLRIYWGNAVFFYRFLEFILKFSGFYNRGIRNSVEYWIEETNVCFRNVPENFKGFRILQLSDLHADAIIDKGELLREKISEIDFDLCVITGDFRFLSYDNYQGALTGVKRIVDSLQCEHGILAVLGNHDFIEMVPGLEAMGIRILLNEAVPIRRNGEVIWIAGVDDPHFYEAHNLKKTFQEVPRREFKVLLAHSPELVEDAANFMVDYYLCGHTHGGQICLPRGIPVITNATCSRKYVSGPWKYQKMAGYTSRGTGSSGLTVRFFCPPEITLHRFI
ncbi:MAG: metallophosphoesterase family protein [Deltaproteobacteria bacterium]|jgi:predicted MPP superfamily phosphohydrolase|nr:metallophosphoesterase family protein [Deltaproteobacteria bacterium]